MPGSAEIFTGFCGTCNLPNDVKNRPYWNIMFGLTMGIMRLFFGFMKPLWDGLDALMWSIFPFEAGFQVDLLHSVFNVWFSTPQGVDTRRKYRKSQAVVALILSDRYRYYKAFRESLTIQMLLEIDLFSFSISTKTDTLLSAPKSHSADTGGKYAECFFS